MAQIGWVADCQLFAAVDISSNKLLTDFGRLWGVIRSVGRRTERVEGWRGTDGIRGSLLHGAQVSAPIGQASDGRYGLTWAPTPGVLKSSGSSRPISSDDEVVLTSIAPSILWS